MAAGQLNSILHHLRRSALAPDGSELSDGQLPQDCISRRGEAAPRRRAREGSMADTPEPAAAAVPGRRGLTWW